MNKYALGEETEAISVASYAVMNRNRVTKINVVSRTRRSSNVVKSSLNYAKSALKSIVSGSNGSYVNSCSWNTYR